MSGDEGGTGNDGGPAFDLLLLGDSGVGKTSLALRFAGDDFGTDPCAKLFTKDVQVKGDGEKLTVKTRVWDVLTDDNGLRSIASTHIKTADGILLLYDVSNYLSFYNVSSWLEAIEEHVKKDCLIMLVGNKGDLRDENRAVSAAEGSGLAKERGLAYVETSALAGTNVEASFRLMVQECYNSMRRKGGKEKKKRKKKKKKEADHEGNAVKKKKKKKKSSTTVGTDEASPAVPRQSASSLLVNKRENKPETSGNNHISGDYGGAALSRRTASSLLAARIQAKHDKYKRRGKRVAGGSVALESITEANDESSSVGPSPDVQLIGKMIQCDHGGEEEEEDSEEDHEDEDEDEEDEDGSKEEGRCDDTTAEIEEGLGPRTQAELVPEVERTAVPMGISEHDKSSSADSAPDAISAASCEDVESDPTNGAPCAGNDSVPPAQDRASAPGPSALNDAGGTFNNKEDDTFENEMDETYDVNGTSQLLEQSSGTLQSTEASSTTWRGPQDYQNGTKKSERVQSAPDDEESAISGAVPVQGERGNPAHTAKSEAKSRPSPWWRRHRWLLLAALIFIAAAAVAGVLFIPRQNDAIPSAIDVMELPPSSSPTAAIVSETTAPTRQPTAIGSPTPTLSRDSCDDDLFYDEDCEQRGEPTAQPSTAWPTDRPVDSPYEPPSGAPIKRPTSKPTSVTPSPTRSPTKVILDMSNPTQNPAKELDPIPCQNDRDWRVQVGGGLLKSCFWVGKWPSKRCDGSVGTDGVTATVACPQQCNPDCGSNGS